MSPIFLPLSRRYGRACAAAPLTRSASCWVPLAISRVPVTSSEAPESIFFRPVARPLLPFLVFPTPSTRSSEPFFALPTPSFRSLAPLAAFSVASWMSENEMKILSRNERDDFVDAAVRTSENTDREICPTM